MLVMAEVEYQAPEIRKILAELTPERLRIVLFFEVLKASRMSMTEAPKLLVGEPARAWSTPTIEVADVKAVEPGVPEPKPATQWLE